MRKDIVPEERSNQKTFNMVYLIDVLKNYGDREPVSLKELSQRCDFCTVYTLRNLLDALFRRTHQSNNSFDFILKKFIRDKESNQFIELSEIDMSSGETYYYKIEFHTKKSEMKLLTDAISMFPFLNADQTVKLIKAIEKICSVPNTFEVKKIMQEYSYKAHTEKTFRKAYASNQFFDVVERINHAIHKGKCVEFEYNMYAASPKKNRLVFAKRSEKIFHPAFFMWSNGFYYLVGREHEKNRDTFMHLRVDRILNVKILDDLRIAKMPKVNPAKYRDENPVMYGGEKVSIEFFVAEFLLNAVVDSFGKNIRIYPTDFTDTSDNEYVKVYTEASIDGARMWLMEYCQYAVATSPVSLVESVKEALLKGLELYKKRC